MVKHIILWKLKECKTQEEKNEIMKNIKTHLELLNGEIDGLLSLNVRIEKLPSSTADLMLNCTFTDENALKGYSKHPKHVAVANTYVRPYTEIRSCIDYEE